MATTVHLRRLGLLIATGTLVACASGPGGGMGTDAGAGTGNSGFGRTASMATSEEQENSPTPGGMGGIMSRTMAGGAGYWTLIGTETGVSWKTPTYSGGGPTR